MSTRRIGQGTSQSADERAQGIGHALAGTPWVAIWDTPDGKSVWAEGGQQDPAASYRLACDLKAAMEAGRPTGTP